MLAEVAELADARDSKSPPQERHRPLRCFERLFDAAHDALKRAEICDLSVTNFACRWCLSPRARTVGDAIHLEPPSGRADV